jgi:hypothetical protein
MTLDFTRKSGDGDRNRRPPPPDYGSSRVRRRLFVILATLMLLSLFISRIRDPNFQNLLGFGNRGIAGGPPLTKGEIATRSVDTELRLPPDRDLTQVPNELFLGNDPPSAAKTGGLVKKGDGATDDLTAPGNGPSSTPLEHAWLDGWTTILHKVDQQERSLFFKGLLFSRRGTSLDEDDRKAWQLIVENADHDWNEYRENAKKSLAELPEAERGPWMEVVEKLAVDWKAAVKPALDRIGEGLDVSGDDAKALLQLQVVLDQLALAMVEDNTMLRASETESWFRLFEDLQNTSPSDLRNRSKGPVGFLHHSRHGAVGLSRGDFQEPERDYRLLRILRASCRRAGFALCGLRIGVAPWISAHQGQRQGSANQRDP